MFRVSGEHVEVVDDNSTSKAVIEWLRNAPDVVKTKGLVWDQYKLTRDRIVEIRAHALSNPSRDVVARTKKEPELPPFLADVKLYSHQPTGIRFLTERASAMLADDMGLGKSYQAAIAAASVGGEVIIFCPASLVSNWHKELKSLGIASRIQRGSDFKFVRGVFSVVSVDGAKVKGDLRMAILEKQWDVMIVDEAHQAKGAQTMRNRFLCSVGAERRWLLTGTPMVNRPMDVYGLLRIAEHPLSMDVTEFTERFRRKDDDSADVSATLGLELCDWILRRYKRDVLDLPGKNRTVVPCETSEHSPTSLGELVRARVALAAEKVQTTVDLVIEAAEAGRSVIVFSCYRAPIERVVELLGRRKIASEVICGGVSMKQRDEIQARFQSKETKVLVAQIDAAGTGLNLTAATTVVFNDLSYSPAALSQAEDRADRIGQTSLVDIYYPVSDCDLDQAIWTLLEKKRVNIGAFEAELGEGETAEVQPEELLSEVRRLHSARTAQK